MEQSTCRPRPGVRRSTLAFLLAGAALIAPALADTGDDADVVGRPAATAPAAPAVDAAVVPSSVFRPRWIEPQRRENGTAPAEAPRDWRRGRVLVHAESRETRLASAVEALLEGLGARDVDRRVVDAAAATDQVRFFHAEDAAMAAELATELEALFGEVWVRDLTFYRPQPSRGALEVWLR